MKITIIGGGNIGTQCAVHCAEQKYKVTVYTSSPELYDNRLNIVDENGVTTHVGNIYLATDNPKEAFREAEIIIVTSTAMILDNIAEIIYNYGNKNAIIGVVPDSRWKGVYI